MRENFLLLATLLLPTLASHAVVVEKVKSYVVEIAQHNGVVFVLFGSSLLRHDVRSKTVLLLSDRFARTVPLGRSIGQGVMIRSACWWTGG